MLNKINSNSTDSRSADGVSLLISILMRFPQIGTIQFDSKYRLLTLNFMLAQTVSSTDLAAVRNSIATHLKAYHFIVGQTPLCLKISTKQPYEKFCMLSIVRDIATLSNGEINLLSTLLAENFRECLILDDLEYTADFVEDADFPDEMIDTMFEVVRAQRAVSSLTAMRENGQVLVFKR
ncbi:MAG: hypothetical protein GYA36_12120 [Veillonellaceae bacterium]|nr:hypothetical protein [Veillonellaceae bacterium]